jgi:uncharacterized protein with NRDE domain
MCLIFLSYNQHPKYPFIAVANRDEFYERPAEPIHHWPENKEIIAGKDLSGGGTWLGVTSTGHFAMLTNYRDMHNIKPNAPTRGKLVSDFLINKYDPATYLQALNASGQAYNGYNIILGRFDDPWYYSNQSNRIYQLGTGSYGLSNALLDTKWPKLTEGKELFDKILEENEFENEALFDMMLDRNLAADELLPETGIGYEKEKQLSSRFILMEGYGTRNTTIVKIDANGKGAIHERIFDRSGNEQKEQVISFNFNN